MNMDVEMIDAFPKEERQPPVPVITEDALKAYYSRLFPSTILHRWLSHGQDRAYFRCREFAFEGHNSLVRFQSFDDGDGLKELLINRCPPKLDIGPVYNVDPEARSMYKGLGDGFYPKERELVFDIDMDGYDDVRRCCEGGNICYKDWSYMAAAILVLDASLKEDFGFEHVLWVYSGRRGVHGWVCDARARRLSDKERGSVADYLSVYKGQQKGVSVLGVANCTHPSIHRALGICQKIWTENILEEQKLFESEQHANFIFDALGDPRIKAGVKDKCSTFNDQQIWHCIENEINKLASIPSERKKHDEVMNNLNKVILLHTYPRLDVAVSKTMNHLLKAPFCVHPKTGRICVPIDIENIWDFNPENVPTVQEVVNQLQPDWDVKNGEMSLDPYVHYFQRFVDEMLESEKKQ